METSGEEFRLPSDVWLNILDKLDYPDIIRCSEVNHQLNCCANHESVWHHLCQRKWILFHCPADLTWKQLFQLWFKDFGRYIQYYAALKTGWNQIKNYLQEQCPQIYESIKEGVSEEELDVVELKLGHKLPEALRCSFRIQNGQRLICSGIMGSMAISNHYRSEALLDLDTALAGYQELRKCLPLTFCVNSGASQFIALAESNGLPLNRVFYLVRDALGSVDNNLFISGNSFLEWFTTYANLLGKGYFPILRRQPFRFVQEKNCEATTGNITVTVGTCFLPEFSTVDPPNFFHTYRITMSMAASALELDSCQLETRHWVITDENDVERTVEGSGVVGEYPTMRPGSTFSWISCTAFETPHGKMHGHFTMRLLQSGDLIKIECPVFHMISLPSIKIAEK